MKYEVIVIWETGEKEVYLYESEEEAKETSNDFRMIFGNQVIWTGTKKVTTWKVTE